MGHPQRSPPHGSPRGATPPPPPPPPPPTTPPPQEPQRKDTNDLEALVEIISQLTAQSLAMTDRLIGAERGKAEAEKNAAIAQATLHEMEKRLTVLQEQYLSQLKALHERMEAETSKAQAALAEWKARPWWRRLAG